MKVRTLIALAIVGIPLAAGAAPAGMPPDEAALFIATGNLQSGMLLKGGNPLAEEPLYAAYLEALKQAAAAPAIGWIATLSRVGVNGDNTLQVELQIITDPPNGPHRMLVLGNFTKTISDNPTLRDELVKLALGQRVRVTGQILGAVNTTFNSLYFTNVDFRLDHIEPAM